MFNKEEYLKRFGAYIKQLRLLHGYSQEELARKCGYTAENSRSTINKIEAGKVDLPLSKLICFSQALDVDVDVLINVADYSEDQMTLIESFSSLNDGGKKNLIDYANYLSEKTEYTEGQ